MKKVQGLMVLLVAVVLAGCVAPPKPYTLGKVFHGVPLAPAEKAQVVIYMGLLEVLYFGNGHEPLPVYVNEDDEVVGVVVPNSYTIYHATPGTHEYWMGMREIFGGQSSSIGHTWLTLATEAGKTYYLRYQQSIFPFWTWGTFKSVPESVALEELETLRQLRFHKELYAAW